MKITVRNLGILSHVEIDVRPLTILVGPNNAGKTWLAYLLGGLFGGIAQQTYVDKYADDELLEKETFLDAIVNDILGSGIASLNMVEFVDKECERYLNLIGSYVSEWIAPFLGTVKADFDQLGVSVTLTDSKKEIQQRILKLARQGELGFGQDKNTALLTAKKSANKPELVFYTSRQRSMDSLPESVVKEFVADSILDNIFQAIYSKIHAFPTERTTFVGFPLEEDRNITTQQMTREEISRLQATSRLASWAMGSFLNMLISLYRASPAKRMRAAKRDASIKQYMDLSQILQEKLLGGMLDFSAPEPGPGREILFQPALCSDSLEISVASSMVKELAPLVLYLRYLAKERELIIIDEPEMNLHPEAQAKMIEFLAMLVNAGLHVLITTHSPYMVDHLENLITAKEHPQQAAKNLERFFLQSEDAFISKDQVAVYLVDKGTATNIFGEDGHIHWDTFSDISEKVGGMYSRLLEEPDEEM